jgi:RNA ligase (TIGR02306 family)
MPRNLATIQRIDNIRPIDNADSIEIATIKGWRVVVKKGQFKIGDPAIYFEIDSLMPLTPQFEFLTRGSSVKTTNIDGIEYSGIVLKTKRLRGVVSQGLALPFSEYPHSIIPVMGMDVSGTFNIVKYEAPIPAEMQGEVKGGLPIHVPKTDAERIQNCTSVLYRYGNIYFDFIEKLDGMSMTVAYKTNQGFSICGRNYEFKTSVNNSLTRMAKHLDLENKLSGLNFDSVVVQGELIGPGIQGNKYKLTEAEFRIFNIVINDNILPYNNLKNFCKDLDLLVCAAVKLNCKLGTLEELLEGANFKSKLNENTNAEGFVVRPHNGPITDPNLGNLSLKIISNKFLLKYDE